MNSIWHFNFCVKTIFLSNFKSWNLAFGLRNLFGLGNLFACRKISGYCDCVYIFCILDTVYWEHFAWLNMRKSSRGHIELSPKLATFQIDHIYWVDGYS